MFGDHSIELESWINLQIAKGKLEGVHPSGFHANQIELRTTDYKKVRGKAPTGPNHPRHT